MSSVFVMNDTTKLQYAALYLLKEMLESTYVFSVNGDDDEEVLDPILDWLKEQGYIYVIDSTEYQITTKGHGFLWTFLDRYNRFLTEYDIFCGVDLNTGDFAFSYFDRYPNVDEWYAFLDQDRWDDLRIAVAEYKGLDALEIVFMSFVNDGRFGRDEDGWKHELLLGGIWDEIQMICNSAVRLQSLTQQKNGAVIPAETIMQGVLDQGQALVHQLRKTGANVTRASR